MSTLVIEHGCNCGPGRLGDVLREHGHRLRTIRIHEGKLLPGDLENVDAIVATGGVQNVHEALPWMEQEMELLRQAHALALPIVGMCLGNQLLAAALGGEVGPVRGGIQLGWIEVELNHIGREDPLFAGIAWKSMQPHWNRYGVTKLPPGARTLAMSAGHPIEAWAAGLRTYGFGFHPEIEPGAFAAWAGEDPEGLVEVGISLEDLQRQTEMMYPTYERLTRRLFENIALLLMPVDRRYGVAKEIHH
jgi:GMP synthase-like glutamine amidotransferase